MSNLNKKLKKELIRRMNYKQIATLMSAFQNVCHELDVYADDVYYFDIITREDIKDQDIWAISNFIASYENIWKIEGQELEGAKAWFYNELDTLPFNGKSPIEYIKSEKVKLQAILQLRFYTSALLTAFNHM